MTGRLLLSAYNRFSSFNVRIFEHNFVESKEKRRKANHLVAKEF